MRTLRYVSFITSTITVEPTVFIRKTTLLRQSIVNRVTAIFLSLMSQNIQSTDSHLSIQFFFTRACNKCYSDRKLTFSKVSRVKQIFPKPSIITESWVYIMNVTYICCVLIGNRYQSQYKNLSSNASNWLFTICPNSDKTKIFPRSAKTNVNVLYTTV